MSSTTGRIPQHRLTAPVVTEPGRAAYSDSDLQPRIVGAGRYAMPERRYVWRDPARWPRFQKPVTVKGSAAKVAGSDDAAKC